MDPGHAIHGESENLGHDGGQATHPYGAGGGGGAGKGFSQIAGIPDSYVVNDDTTIGVGKKIPLWLFGFLY